VDNLWTTGAPGDPGSVKLPNSPEEYHFSGILWFRQLARRARPGEWGHGRMAEISHLFLVDRRTKPRYSGQTWCDR